MKNVRHWALRHGKMKVMWDSKMFNVALEPPTVSNEVFVIVAKIAGAIAGSAISLVYVLPKGKREAFARFFVGLGIGIIFGAATGHALADQLGVASHLSDIETTLSGSAAASLCAWWGLGLLSRFAQGQIKQL